MGDARIILWIVACLPVFSGCATTKTGQVQEVEPGTYTIGYGTSYGTTQDTAMNDAVGKAGEYCHSRGQKLFVVPNTGNEIRFRCVPSDKPASANSAPSPR
jgi:hypothetical protein